MKIQLCNENVNFFWSITCWHHTTAIKNLATLSTIHRSGVEGEQGIVGGGGGEKEASNTKLLSCPTNIAEASAR